MDEKRASTVNLIPLSIRQIFIALTLAPLGILFSGFILGEFLRLKVCYLCNFQRFLYLAMAVFALGGVALPRLYRFFGGLCAVTAAGGIVAAAYQSWMQFVPDATMECGTGDPSVIERLVDWLGAQWPSLFMVTGLCSEKDWIFLGLSLANWSFLVYCAFFAALLWVLLWYQPRGR